MKNNSKPNKHPSTDELEKELHSINELIAKLKIRANTVENLIDRNQSIPTSKSKGISVGDQVIVLLKYKGRFGTIGTVTKISGSYGWVISETNQQTIQVHLANLKLYNE